MIIQFKKKRAKPVNQIKKYKTFAFFSLHNSLMNVLRLLHVRAFHRLTGINELPLLYFVHCALRARTNL